MTYLQRRLMAAAMLAGSFYPATADDWTACKYSSPDTRVAACTRIIDKGGADAFSLALAHNNRGSAHRALGDKEKAIADYQESARLDPPHAGHNRGLIHVTKGENDRAIAEYTEVLRANPKDALAFTARGSAHYAKREFDAAIADHTSAIEIDPKLVIAYNSRGVAYIDKGDRDAALADYTKAIELEPGHALAYSNRGNSWIAKKEFDRAIADFDKAIALDPGYSNAYNNRGRAHGQKGERDAAIADLTRAIEVNPKNHIAHNNRGVAHKARGDLDAAIADYTKAIEIDPKYALAYSNRGGTYEAKGERDLAMGDYRFIVDLPVLTPTDLQRQEIARQRIARLTQAQRATETPSRAAPVDPPKPRVALVIGNSDYTSVGRLTNPKHDAEDIAKALVRLGFGVSEHRDLTREKMGRALRDFQDRAEGAEWAIIFFAGHGLEMNRETYLIPTDAELKRDTHVAHETISLTQVQAAVDPASKIGLVFLDACRNNPFLERMTRSTGRERSIGRGLANVEPEGSILVAYSAKHGTTASDGPGQRNSPFTDGLLAHIEEPGLEVNFLFRRVREHVMRKTLKRQEPYIYGSLGMELLYFKPAGL